MLADFGDDSPQNAETRDECCHLLQTSGVRTIPRSDAALILRLPLCLRIMADASDRWCRAIAVSPSASTADHRRPRQSKPHTSQPVLRSRRGCILLEERITMNIALGIDTGGTSPTVFVEHETGRVAVAKR
jgi:hypothetical protein